MCKNRSGQDFRQPDETQLQLNIKTMYSELEMGVKNNEINIVFTYFSEKLSMTTFKRSCHIQLFGEGEGGYIVVPGPELYSTLLPVYWSHNHNHIHIPIPVYIV